MRPLHRAEVHLRVRPGREEVLHLQDRDEDRVRAGVQDPLRAVYDAEGSHLLQEGLRPVPGDPLRHRLRAVPGNSQRLQDGPDLG